jgi:hypothetical protein
LAKSQNRLAPEQAKLRLFLSHCHNACSASAIFLGSFMAQQHPFANFGIKVH